MYLKLMIDGIASEPFSARGLPPLLEEEKTENLEKVVKVSRERYAKSRGIVEEKIMRWHSNDEENLIGKEPAQPEKKSFSAEKVERKKELLVKQKIDQPKKEGFETLCSKCGQKTSTIFKPDGVRPVYCKECLSLLRQEKKNEEEKRRRAKEEELKRVDAGDFTSQKNNKPFLRQLAGVKSSSFNNRNNNRPNISNNQLSKAADEKQAPVNLKNKNKTDDGQELNEGKEINLGN